jgi:hypothetical protein
MLEIRGYIDNNVNSNKAVFSDISITADITTRLFDAHTVLR